MRTQIIHLDDFHRPLSLLEYSSQEDEINVFYNEAFDIDKLLSDVLLPLSKTSQLHKTFKGLNWISSKYENDIIIDIEEDTVVLFEGMLLFRRPLNSYFNYLIYLDVKEEAILQRGKIRDVPKFGIEILDKYKTRYIPVLR